MRIILDTNLWISFLISSKFDQLDALLFDGKCTLLFSHELLEEFIAVAKRPKLRNYISREEMEDLLDMIDEIDSRNAAKYLLVMLCHAPAGIAARCILVIAFDTNWRCNAS